MRDVIYTAVALALGSAVILLTRTIKGLKAQIQESARQRMATHAEVMEILLKEGDNGDGDDSNGHQRRHLRIVPVFLAIGTGLGALTAWTKAHPVPAAVGAAAVGATTLGVLIAGLNPPSNDATLAPPDSGPSAETSTTPHWTPIWPPSVTSPGQTRLPVPTGPTVSIPRSPDVTPEATSSERAITTTRATTTTSSPPADTSPVSPTDPPYIPPSTAPSHSDQAHGCLIALEALGLLDLCVRGRPVT